MKETARTIRAQVQEELNATRVHLDRIASDFHRLQHVYECREF